MERKITTLKDLGLEPEHDEQLLLARERLTLVKDHQQPNEQTVYLGHLDRALAGTQLVTFLEATALFDPTAYAKHPAKKFLDTKKMIAEDLKMPDKAARDSKYGDDETQDMYLSRIHLGDPDISEQYRAFVVYDRARVKNALETREVGELSVFTVVKSLGFVDQEQYSKEVIDYCINSLVKPRETFDAAVREVTVPSAIDRYLGEDFMNFFGEEPWTAQERKNYYDLDKRLYLRGYKYANSRDGMYAYYLANLLPADRVSFAMRYAVADRPDQVTDALADIDRKTIWQSTKAAIAFTDQGDLSIEDTFGNRLVVVPDKTENGYKARIKDMHLADTVRKNGVYLLLAWQNNGSSRGNIGQAEATALQRRAKIPHPRQSSVALGSVLGAYLSPDKVNQIKEDRGTRMAIAEGRYPQQISALQTPVFYRLPDITPYILGDNNEVYPKLEAVFD